MFFIFAIIFIIIIVIILLRTDQCLDLEWEQPAVVPGVGEAAWVDQTGREKETPAMESDNSERGPKIVKVVLIMCKPHVHMCTDATRMWKW